MRTVCDPTAPDALCTRVSASPATGQYEPGGLRAQRRNARRKRAGLAETQTLRQFIDFCRGENSANVCRIGFPRKSGHD